MDEHLEQKFLSEEAIRSSGVSRSRTALYMLFQVIDIVDKQKKKKKTSMKCGFRAGNMI